jgi:hypothetical protein
VNTATDRENIFHPYSIRANSPMAIFRINMLPCQYHNIGLCHSNTVTCVFGPAILGLPKYPFQRKSRSSCSSCTVLPSLASRYILVSSSSAGGYPIFTGGYRRWYPDTLISGYQYGILSLFFSIFQQATG